MIIKDDYLLLKRNIIYPMNLSEKEQRLTILTGVIGPTTTSLLMFL